MSTDFEFSFGYAVTYQYNGEPREQNPIFTSPKYIHLKDELINNPIWNITFEVFIRLYGKATRHLGTPLGKSISGRYDEDGFYWTLTQDYLVAAMMYCNYSDFCYKFRQTYRLNKGQSHGNFYHMGKCLKILVHKFGSSVNDENRVFYHGVSKKMLLPQYYGQIKIYIPLSTTPVLGAASVFAGDNNGMILQFSACQNAKYFDVAWLSNLSYYKHESELLFVNTDLNIVDIILPEYGFFCTPVLSKMYDIHKLFHNKIMEIRNLSPQSLRKIITRQLSQPESWGLSPALQYGANMIHIYLNNQMIINIDCDQIKNSVYRSALSAFFYSIYDQCEWVKISELTKLFKNLEEIIVQNIKLSTFMFKNIYNHILRNEMSKVQVIEIDKIKEYNDINSKQLINNYVIKFYKLDWVLRFTDDNLLLFKRNSTRMRMRKHGIYSRPINNAICHSNAMSEDDGDTDEEYKEFKSEYHYKYETINGKTYVLPKEYTNIGPVFSYGTEWPDDIIPKYKHLKEELLNNTYDDITKADWNKIGNKCKNILGGKENKRWAAILKANSIGLKHLIALKLYTDCEKLQKEFTKSFRAPHNTDKQRMSEFYHWKQLLLETFERFRAINSTTKQPNTVFHGINSVMCIDKYKGTYYGPCSTTTDIRQARQFAGKNGMILVIRLKPGAHNGLDVSWISDLPGEGEFLLFNDEIEIESWLLSSEYDQYYHVYHNILDRNNSSNNSSNVSYDHYEKQLQSSNYLSQLKSMVYEEKCNHETKIKQYVQFGNNELAYEAEIHLLNWLCQFALKYNSQTSSKYDQSINGNIQHVMKLVHEVHIPQKFINDLKQKFDMEMSNNNIILMLNEYFVNTHCSMNTA